MRTIRTIQNFAHQSKTFQLPVDPTRTVSLGEVAGDTIKAQTTTVNTGATLKFGNTAKYALQIGQFNPNDLQPPSTTVAFENNAPWAQFTGSVDATGPAHDYLVAIPAGETLKVNLIPNAPSVHFKVMDSATNAALADPTAENANTFTTTATAATTYKVRVYANPADVPSGQRATYALQIGHYTAGAVAPAEAGSVPAKP